MKILGIAIALVLIIGVNVWASNRDEKLMALCPDFQTQTLNDCK